MRRIAALLSALALVGGGTGLAVAANGGNTTQNAAKFEYSGKPGCGPQNSDGVDGSGVQHSGDPPPNEPNRDDCPPK
jgi:hypothetical protein